MSLNNRLNYGQPQTGTFLLRPHPTFVVLYSSML
jgi:hypothetical protein